MNLRELGRQRGREAGRKVKHTLVRQMAEHEKMKAAAYYTMNIGTIVANQFGPDFCKTRQSEQSAVRFLCVSLRPFAAISLIACNPVALAYRI